MRALLASPRGFCAGVDRAIEVVEEALEIFGAPIYVRHEIVHNEYVVERLRRRGAVFTDDLSDVPEGSVLIFSAHGVAPAVRAEAVARHLRVIDATCPLVTKIHLEVHKFLKRGYGIFYIGHKGHVETEGTLGEAPGRLHLVTEVAEVAALPEPPEDRLIYLTQTTLSIDETDDIVRALKARFPRLQDPPTGDICYATQNRQDAIKVIAPQSDVVFVIGSQTSSNTKSLRKVAETLGTRAFLIGGAEDITDAMLAGAESVGVTSGASAPEDRVQGVLDELRRRGVGAVEEVRVRDEDVAFVLPRELIQLRMASVPPEKLLAGRVALVTGAGRGIGTAVARLFAAQGATVLVHYHTSAAPAELLAREIGGLALGADLTDPAATEAMVADALSHMGRIDVLVNNASSFAHDLDFEAATWDDFRAEFDGVVGATVNPTRAVVPAMKRQGGGRIVNYVATLVQRPAAEYVVHTTAKSALIGLTRTLARDLGPHGITVNMVSPGMTLTDYSQALPEKLKKSVTQQTPLRRLATAEDVARVVLFYASPLADFVTGANIAPDGGLAVL